MTPPPPLLTLLSVVIPAYNEESRIEPTLQGTAAYLKRQPYSWEIVIVDDGSRDRTAARVEAFTRSDPRIRLVRHGANRGKGAAVRTGLLASEGEAVLFCDADGATPIEETIRLMESLRSGSEFVVGSRRMKGSVILRKQGWTRRFMSDIYHWICRWVFQVKVQDLVCGFKLLSRRAVQEIAPRMRIPGWSFDVEMLVIARLHRLRVEEVPVRWIHQERSKVRPGRDAVRSLAEMFRILSGMIRGAYR